MLGREGSLGSIAYPGPATQPAAPPPQEPEGKISKLASLIARKADRITDKISDSLKDSFHTASSGQTGHKARSRLSIEAENSRAGSLLAAGATPAGPPPVAASTTNIMAAAAAAAVAAAAAAAALNTAPSSQQGSPTPAAGVGPALASASLPPPLHATRLSSSGGSAPSLSTVDSGSVADPSSPSDASPWGDSLGMHGFEHRPSRKGIYLQLLGEQVEVIGEKGTKVGSFSSLAPQSWLPVHSTLLSLHAPHIHTPHLFTPGPRYVDARAAH